jgi:sulfatase maturation enzyme AslB (radical SAM superfamily)
MLPRPPRPRPVQAPPAFHLLVKPTGAACNLDCAYCYFLDNLYPKSNFGSSGFQGADMEKSVVVQF